MASRVEQRRGAGRDRNMHALAGGVADQVEEIFALQRVAAGEDEDGNVHLGDLVDERFAFFVGELVRMRNGLGGGAAVLAGQVTGLRDLPDGEEGRFVVVDPAAGGNVVHRLHETSSGIAAVPARKGPAPGDGTVPAEKYLAAAERTGRSAEQEKPLPRATIPV